MKFKLERSFLRRTVATAVTVSLLGTNVTAAYATSADESLGLTNMSRRNTQRIAVQQAIIILASESADIDGDGYYEPPVMRVSPNAPSGGGSIPLSSAAPKNDSYGTDLGYCAFDNGSVNSSSGRINGVATGYTAPVLAVITAGADNVFQTSCADVAAGTGAKGDDYLIVYNSSQIQMGNSGTLFHGDPVPTVASLSTLDPASLKNGQLRMVTGTNELYAWNAIAGSWGLVKAQSSSIAISQLTGATAANSIGNGSFPQSWGWSLSADTTGLALGETAASVGGAGAQYIQTISTAPGSTAIPFSVRTRGIEALRIDSSNPQVLVNSGSSGAPGLAFIGRNGTGLFSPSSSEIAMSINGTKNFSLDFDKGNFVAFGAIPSSSTGTDNISIGKSFYGFVGNLDGITSGSRNVSLGPANMRSMSSGSDNFSVGYSAMYNTNGDNNIVIGGRAMLYGGGSNNYVFGPEAFRNGGGSNNVAMGYMSVANAQSSNNIGIGETALANTQNGGGNIALGPAALISNENGEHNIGLGWNSGQNSHNGSRSTFLGAFTAVADTDAMHGSGYVTLVGSSSYANLAGGSANEKAYMTALGAESVVTTINTVVLGRVIDKTVIGANGDNGSPALLQVTGAAQLVGLPSAPLGAAGMIYYDAPLKKLRYNDGAVWRNVNDVSLSQLTGAVSNNSINNGNYNQSWSWALAGNMTALSLQESAASTGGTGTQAIVSIGTLSGSTASPLVVSSGGVEAFRVAENRPQLLANSGALLYPSYSFNTDRGIGFYSAAPGVLAAAQNGTRTMTIANGNGVTSLGVGAAGAVNISSTNNSLTAIGYLALSANTTGTSNTAVGSNALRSNVSGANNIAVGASAMLWNSQGQNNVAVGQSSLLNNWAGSQVTAIGGNSLPNNTTGGNSVSVGYASSYSNTTGGGNTSLGFNASYGNQTGGNNVAAGAYALRDNTNSSNTAIGYAALSNFTTGTMNAGIGFAAGNGGNANSLTSQYSTMLGANTFINAPAASSGYMTAVGAGAGVSTANTVVLGRPTDTTVIGSTASTGSAALLQINGASQHVGIPTASAPSGSAGMLYYDSTLNRFQFHNGTAWKDITSGARPTLSSLSSADIANTIDNSAFAQAWNWRLTGNSTGFAIGETAASTGGTGTQYLHTISTLAGSTAIPLAVNVRGVEAFHIDSINPQIQANVGTAALPSYSFVGNPSTGFYAPGTGQLGATVGGVKTIYITSSNTSFGLGAMAACCSYGNSNLALGNNAMANMNGAFNSTAVGFSALQANTTGRENTAVGTSALSANTTGGGNTAIGFYALVYPATGSNNSAVGFESLRNAGGGNNTGIGYQAGRTSNYGLSGNYNTFVGSNSTVTDNYNTNSSGYITLVGANSTATFQGTLSSAYATAIGAGSLVTSANSIVLGRTTDKTVIGASSASGSAALLQITGASQHIGLSAAPTGSAGMMYYDSSLARFQYFNGATWRDLAAGAHPTLSSVAAADSANTINNAAFAQGWNWQLTGNTTGYSIGETAASAGGTGTQYLAAIGTLSGSTAVPLVVRTQGVEAFRIDSINPQVVFNNGSATAPSMSFAGDQSTGFYLPMSQQLAASVSGVRSMLIDSQSMVTSVGYNALSKTTATANSAFGYAAMQNNTTGSSNSAFGAAAMRGSTTGANNSAFGANAMGRATGGAYVGNSAFGSGALQGILSGTNNVAVGFQALQSSTAGSSNVAVGYNALAINIGGSNNTALGASSGAGTSGSNNTFVGSQAAPATDNTTRSSGSITLLGANTSASGLPTSLVDAYMTALGAGSSVTTANTVVLGRAQDATVIGSTADNLSGNRLQVSGGIQSVSGNITNASGQFLGAAGTASLPTYGFTGEANSGLYMPAAGQMAVSLAGSRALWLSSGSVSVGLRALSTGAGDFNSALGVLSLANNTGNANTAVGWNALSANTSGSSNVGVGSSALFANVTGAYNTAVGSSSLYNSTGDGNSAFGMGSLQNTSTGQQNTAVGYQSLSLNDTGSGNVALGASSLVNNAAGSKNTAVGYFAGNGNDSSANSSNFITLLGANTSASAGSAGDAYMTALGAGAAVSTFNTVVLGRTTDSVVIGQTSSGPQQFYVNGTAGGSSAYAVSSDIRFKTNIRKLLTPMAVISNLQGVSYEFNQAAFPLRKFESGRQLGFIAQQIEPFVPEIVRTDSLGYKSVQYSQLVPLIVEGMKEQQGILQHFSKPDELTISLNIPTIEGNAAHFKRVETEILVAKAIEIESAKINKLKALEIDAEKIQARSVRSDVVKTGELQAYIGAGAFQPLFTPAAGSQYIVSATAEDGSVAFATVSMVGTQLFVTPMSPSKGVDIVAYGQTVGVSAANKSVKTTWIRMS